MIGARLTVGDIRKAIEGLPDEMPVTVEARCSEGCGVGFEGCYSAFVECRPIWDREDTLYLSSEERP
jgi:hypothetical protein